MAECFVFVHHNGARNCCLTILDGNTCPKTLPPIPLALLDSKRKKKLIWGWEFLARSTSTQPAQKLAAESH